MGYMFNSCNIKNVIIEQPQRIEIENMSLQTVKLKILLPVENSNNFSFKIKSVNLDVKLNNEIVGKINKVDKIKIPANSKNIYPFSIEISLKDALSKRMQVLNNFSKTNSNIEVLGVITISKLGIPKHIAVNHKENLTL